MFSLHTFTGLELIGSNATYIKRRADYPSIKGEYKTDPTFIGVT